MDFSDVMHELTDLADRMKKQQDVHFWNVEFYPGESFALRQVLSALKIMSGEDDNN